LVIAVASQLPMPGRANTVSVWMAPESSRPACRPITVETGRSALRSTWRRSTTLGGRPLARAVRT
jgi:hypothetical protein